MFKLEKSIVIRRPIDEVFGYVGDQANAPQWQSGLLEVRRTTDGPLGVGTKHTLVRKLMGRNMAASNEYIVFEPNKRIRFRVMSGPMTGEASYLVESTADGTKLTSTIEMEAAGLLRFAEPLIAASIRREAESNLARLKELLERRGPVRRDAVNAY